MEEQSAQVMTFVDKNIATKLVMMVAGVSNAHPLLTNGELATNANEDVNVAMSHLWCIGSAEELSW